MRRAAYPIVSLILTLLVAGSFTGRWLALGDALAVGRPALALALAVWLLPRLTPLWAVLPGLMLAGFALVSVAVPFGIAPPPGPLGLYQKNLSFRMTDPAALLADIRAMAPDIITLQEVTEAHRAGVMQALATTYPTQAFCPFAAVGGTAVLARWPAAGPAICAKAGGATILPLQTPFGRVTAVSLHLHWPYPYGQRAQLEGLQHDLAAPGGAMVIGGDFNMVPWGWPLARLGQATGTQRAGAARATFHVGGWWPLAIDHVLAPGSGMILPRDRLGSDHLGLMARVWP